MTGTTARLFVVLGIIVSYVVAYLMVLDHWGLKYVAPVPLIITIVAIFIVTGLEHYYNRQRKDLRAAEKRSYFELYFDLLSDVFVAVFVATDVGIYISLFAHEEARLLPDELLKEAFYAGSTAAISFAALIMLRTALLVHSKVRLDETLAQIEGVLRNVIDLEGRALKLSAESGAGTALAGLIKQIPPIDIKSAIWKEQREILTAAGTSAQYWVSYASEGAREDDVEQARPIVRFTAAKVFLRESASDMARQERLAVSNIRYVTSLVCSTLIALQKLAAKRGPEWRPVWFGLTTYAPDLWFEDPHAIKSDSKRFLEDSGLPSRTMHLQYWGRYLRNLRYLMQEAQAPVSLRVFSSRDADFDSQKHDFQNLWVLDCLHPYNNGGGESRLTQFVPGEGRYEFSRKFAQELAEQLASDAAWSISNERFLQTERGGELKEWLHELFRMRESQWGIPDFLQAWHKKHSGRISEIVRVSFEEMHAWELTYFSQRPNDANAPIIRAGRAEKFIRDKTNGEVVLEYVDGNPLEVFLDALLLYCDAKRDDGMAKTASSLLVERWHRGSGSRACRIAKPLAQPAQLKTPEQMLDGLVFNLPEHGDIHAFGLVPVGSGPTEGNASVEWDKAEWLLAAKSGMSSLLGIARVDFLEIHNPGQISLTELRNPIGQRSRGGDLVPLSKIVAGLTTRQEQSGQKFEILG